MKSPFETNLTPLFNWQTLNAVNEGRENLGDEVPISVYRLFEYAIRAALTETYGKEECVKVLVNAGRIAGESFAENNLDLTLDLNSFLACFQTELSKLKIGLLRIEDFDEISGNATLTISEDLDCAGLPIIGETVCNYEEGFIAGVLSTYTKKNYTATEIDCWAKGDRVCRFKAKIENS